MSKIPFVSFSNDELAKAPACVEGSKVLCERCGQEHVLEASKPPMLLFYKCGSGTYLAGLKGAFVGKGCKLLEEQP